MRVSALMSSRVLTIVDTATCCEAVRLMIRRRIRHLPVVDDAARLRGIVTMRDLRHYLFEPEIFAAIGTVTVERLLRAVPVREVMSTPVVTIAPHERVEEATRRMLAERVGALPVVIGDRVVGILTETDLLRHISGADAGCAAGEPIVVSSP